MSGPRRAALARHVRDPLRSSGYALVSSSIITSGLGVLYWLIAARRYSEADVGRGAALIAAMGLVSAVTQLGLRNGLVRFVPTAGAGRRRLVLTSYLLSGGLAFVGAMVTLTALRSWIPDLEEVGPSFSTVAWFAVATMFWTIFILQDSVLTGIGRASFVPVENFVFSVAKIALLIGFATAFPRNGVFVSWTLPVVVLLAPITVYLFRRGLDHRPGEQAEPVSMRSMVGFMAGEYIATSLWSITGLVLPLIVLATKGAEASAHYYLAFSTAYVLYLIASNIGHALIARASRDRSRLVNDARRALGQAALLVVPAALVGVIVAPWYLRLFGSAYEENATTLLQLMLLGAIPNLLVATYTSVARIQLRIRVVVWVYAALAVVLMVGSPLLLARYGLGSLGLLWVAAEVAMALVVVVIGFWDLWVHFPGPGLTRRLGSMMPSRALEDPGTDLAVELPDDAAGQVLKSARTAAGARELESACEVMTALGDDHRLAPLHPLVPHVLQRGVRDGLPTAVETRMPGVELTVMVDDPTTRWPAIEASARSISVLHDATARQVTVDQAVIDSWVTTRTSLLHHVTDPRHASAIDAFTARVRTAVEGRRVTVARTHGDLAPGNILLDPDSGAVTGIIDWGRSTIDDLPETDLAHLLLAVRVQTTGYELGQAVLDVLESGWTPEERAVIDASANHDLPHDAVVLLTWLSHVHSNLDKSSTYERSRIWAARNVHAVLAAVDRPLVGRQ